MNNKDGFLIYKSQYSAIKILTSEEKSELLDAIFSYQIEGKIGDLSPRLCIAFAFIKNQFEIDNAKYKKTCEKNYINGSKGVDQEAINPKNPLGYLATQKTQTNPKKPIMIRIMVKIMVKIMIRIKNIMGYPKSFLPQKKVIYSKNLSKNLTKLLIVDIQLIKNWKVN